MNPLIPDIPRKQRCAVVASHAESSNKHSLRNLYLISFVLLVSVKAAAHTASHVENLFGSIAKSGQQR
jgi:hypothetical protein